MTEENINMIKLSWLVIDVNNILTMTSANSFQIIYQYNKFLTNSDPFTKFAK